MGFPLLTSKVWFDMSTGQWQFFHPFSIRIIQSLLEPIHYNFVNSLGLTIPLGVSRGKILIRNSQITVVSPESFTIKLKSIVQDEGTRDLESCDSVFPNKFLGIHVPDICQGLSFNPLCEVVCTDQQVSFIPHCLGERANDI